MCHDLFKVTTVLDIQFRFLPRITFWVDHLCVMLRIITQKILLFFSLLFCYFNKSANFIFIHRAPQTFVWKPQPHLSMPQGDLERIKESEMWFYQWLKPFSLMQVLLEHLNCFKPLWRVLFILFVILLIMISLAKKGLCRFWTNIAVSVR